MPAEEEWRARQDARIQMAREAVRRLPCCPHPGGWVQGWEDVGFQILTSCRCQLCGRTWITVQDWPPESESRSTGYW